MIDNVEKLEEARQRRKRGAAPPPPPDEKNKAIIRIEAGRITELVNQAEAALMAGGGFGIYRQDKRLIQIGRVKAKAFDGSSIEVLQMVEVSKERLLECFGRAAQFERWNERAGDWRVCNCPAVLAETYLSRKGLEWNVPFLKGVVSAPLLREDGSLLDAPGYDEQTALFFDPQGVVFPDIPALPTREEALAALEKLKWLLRSFPFHMDKETGLSADRSVALSAILTTLCRRGLPSAPLHGFSAPVAGAGKSLLVDIASIIATGERASVTTPGRDKGGEEFEKKLSAALLGGDAVLSIDNLEKPLSSELLCQLLTQPSLKIRQFGTLASTNTPSVASIFATGNNLMIEGDLTRRSLVGKLDVDEERPEFRRFEFDALVLAREQRAELVVAAVTVMLAFVQAEERIYDLATFGSFEKWAERVREPLIWLGEADPLGVLEEVRRSDPKLEALAALMGAWEKEFGEEEVLLRDAVAKAMKSYPDSNVPECPELRDAFASISFNGRITSRALGQWLRRNRERVHRGRRFKHEQRPGEEAFRWHLKGAKRAQNEAENEEQGEIPL